jgi:hypothetical protein
VNSRRQQSAKVIVLFSNLFVTDLFIAGTVATDISTADIFNV